MIRSLKKGSIGTQIYFGEYDSFHDVYLKNTEIELYDDYAVYRATVHVPQGSIHARDDANQLFINQDYEIKKIAFIDLQIEGKLLKFLSAYQQIEHVDFELTFKNHVYQYSVEMDLGDQGNITINIKT